MPTYPWNLPGTEIHPIVAFDITHKQYRLAEIPCQYWAILDTGFWMLVARFSMPASGYRINLFS